MVNCCKILGSIPQSSNPLRAKHEPCALSEREQTVLSQSPCAATFGLSGCVSTRWAKQVGTVSCLTNFLPINEGLMVTFGKVMCVYWKGRKEMIE